MNKEDMGAMKSIVDQSIASATEGLKASVIKELKVIVETAVDDRVTIATDILRQEIRSTKTELRGEIQESESRIMNAISDVHDVLVKPRFHDLERRVKRLEAKIA